IERIPRVGRSFLSSLKTRRRMDGYDSCFRCRDARCAASLREHRRGGSYDRAAAWVSADVYALVREHLKIAEPIVLVGHDVGVMVALAYGMRFRDSLSHLVLIDAPLQRLLCGKQ